MSIAMGDSTPASDLRRALGFWTGVAIVIGSIVGSGIFRTPAEIARALPHPHVVLGLWVAFGLVSLCGALTLAELATLLPRTGGTYVFLQRAYGDGAAFTFGWLYLVGATPAALGTLAVVFSEQLVELATGQPALGSPLTVKAIAVAGVLILTIINVVGVVLAAAVQSFFTLVKMAALAALIVVAVAAGGGNWLNLSSSGEVSAGGLAQAAAFIIFSYNGWAYLGLVAGEIKNPERQVSRIILTAMAIVIMFYLGTNFMYYLRLSSSEMAAETVIARRVAADLVGPVGGLVMNACILASVFGTLCAVVLTNSRVPYAMARDGLGFAFLGRCHPRFVTPHWALVVQGAISIALVLWLESFARLSTYFVLVEWSALVAAIAAVFALRRRMPDAPRAYRTPLYPWVPLVFIVVVSVFLVGIAWGSAAGGDWTPIIGLLIAAAGFPAYSVWRYFTPAASVASREGSPSR